MRRRWLRALLLAVALLVLALAGGLWLLVQGVDRGAVMARAVQEVKTATGRDFAVDGPVRFKLFPRLALVAEGVRLGNAPWGSRPEMARIRQLRFDLALAPLLERRVEIGQIEISGADLLLETNADGQGNWSFERMAASGEASPESRKGAPIRVTLARLSAQDAKLTWQSGGRAETVDIESLVLERHPDPARPPGAWQVAIDAAWRAQKLHAKGGVGMQRDESTGASSVALDLGLGMEGATASIDGRLGLGSEAGQAQLKVQAEIQSTQALGRMLEVPLPLPLPARLGGNLALHPRQLQIDNFEMEAQGQTVAGGIVWDRSATPPSLQLALHSDGLDLARLYPAAQRTAPSASEAKGGDGRVFSDTPLPALKLPHLAIQADLRAERLVLPGGLELATVKLRGGSRPGRIELTQLDFGLARGSFNVSGLWQQPEGSAPPSVSAQVKARGVALDAVLALMRRETSISGGRTELDGRLSATGNSPRRLASSLSGEVRMRMGEANSAGRRSSGSVPGELVSALLHALTPLRSPGDSFKVLCAAARLPVKAGRIEIDRSIAVEGERVDVVMSGLIDLANERVDLGMRPTVKKGTGLDPSAFAGVVKIAGPLASPQVQVSLAGTAREAVTIGAAVATGGATLLGERLLGKVTDARPCESAYSGSAKTSAQEPAPKKTGGFPRPLRNLWER